MLDRMKNMLRQNDLCALATCRDDKPHCSLMTYVTDEEGLTVYMITNKKTVKWENIAVNPRVSLMVDTRTRVPGMAGAGVMALTVEGTVIDRENQEENRRIIEDVVARRPQLGVFASDPDTVPLVVKVDSFLLLDGVLDSHYVKV